MLSVLGAEPAGILARRRSSIRPTSGSSSTYPRVLFNRAAGKSSRPVKHPQKAEHGGFVIPVLVISFAVTCTTWRTKRGSRG